MPFVKATKPKKAPKVAITGPSGSGKTHTALEIALHWSEGKRVAMIDTESGRGLLFARKYDYDTQLVENDFNPEKFIKMIDEARTAKDDSGQPAYGVIIIDSLTHAWSGPGGILDKVANAPGNNSYTDGWGKVGTPLQKKLMAAIISCKVPIICTMRVKTDTVLEQNEKGKMVPVTKGMKADQRDDVVYEFDFILNVDMQHYITVQKCPPIEGLMGSTIAPNNISLFANQIMSWMNDGDSDPSWNWKDTQEDWAEMSKLIDPSLKDEARKLYAEKGKTKMTIQQAWQILKAKKPVPTNGNKEPA